MRNDPSPRNPVLAPKPPQPRLRMDGSRKRQREEAADDKKENNLEAYNAALDLAIDRAQQSDQQRNQAMELSRQQHKQQEQKMKELMEIMKKLLKDKSPQLAAGFLLLERVSGNPQLLGNTNVVNATMKVLHQVYTQAHKQIGQNMRQDYDKVSNAYEQLRDLMNQEINESHQALFATLKMPAPKPGTIMDDELYNQVYDAYTKEHQAVGDRHYAEYDKLNNAYQGAQASILGQHKAHNFVEGAKSAGESPFKTDAPTAPKPTPYKDPQ